MKILKLYILCIFSIFFLCLSGQNLKNVQILPGVGVIIEKDTIILHKTTLSETCQTLGVKFSKPKIWPINHWNGVTINEQTKISKDTSGSYYGIEINYKSIVFEFIDEKDPEKLILESISLESDKSLIIKLKNGLGLGTINPNISEIYPIVKKVDEVSEDALTYKLYSQGITFYLERNSNNELNLSKIVIHNKIN